VSVVAGKGRRTGSGYRLKNVCPSRRPRSRPVRHTGSRALARIVNRHSEHPVTSLMLRTFVPQIRRAGLSSERDFHRDDCGPSRLSIIHSSAWEIS
jgi:hypothetical protein